MTNKYIPYITLAFVILSLGVARWFTMPKIAGRQKKDEQEKQSPAKAGKM